MRPETREEQEGAGMEENRGAFEEQKNEPAAETAQPERADAAAQSAGPHCAESAAAGDKRPAKGGKKGGLAAGVVLGVLAAAYLGLGAWVLGAQRFYPNTGVNGVACGGMTVQELAAQLNANAEKARSGGVRFVLADGTEIAYSSFDGVPQADHTPCAERAFARGGCGEDSILTAGARYLRALSAPEEIIAESEEGTNDALLALARTAGRGISCEPVEFSIALTDDDRVCATKPTDGRKRTDGAERQIADALFRAYFSGGEQAEFTLLPVTADNADGAYETVPARTVDLAAEREKLIGRKVNASYDIENGRIVPSRVGVSFTLADLQSAYDAAAPGVTFTVRAAVERPEVTTEQLETGLFRDELSSYTTRVKGAPGRHKNVQITAERINGYILNAGDTMKYGPLVTPFTAENGYYPAPGYLKGKTVDMIGGGACQASSTLYAAVLYANLEIVQRVNHGFASDYIGLGLDATVAEGGPEFEFRNDTLYPIKVQAEFFTKDKKDYIKVTLLGTKTDDRYVKMVTEVLSTTPFEEELVETDELAPGERKVEQTAYTGYYVKTYRNVYAGDGTLLSSAYEATSNYRARNRIVLVGKAAEPAVGPGPETGEPAGPEEESETPPSPPQTPEEEQTLPAEPEPPAEN